MKKNILTVICTMLVAVSVFLMNTSVQAAKAFPDVAPGSWYYGYVTAVADAGYITGYGDGRFGPTDNLTRGQFATILYRMEGSSAVEFKNTFPDVKDGLFYSLPAEWANQEGLITGYMNVQFGPNDNLTREQLATIMYRYAKWEDDTVVAAGDYSRFPDADKVSPFAEEAMDWAVGEDIITGNADGTLAPQGTVSRAVAATIIARYTGLGDESQDSAQYKITLVCGENGTASVDKTSARYGQEVTVTVHSDEGYLESVFINNAGDESKSYSWEYDPSKNSYTFSMPDCDVIIRVDFYKGYEDHFDWEFYDGAELTARNDILEGLTYCEGSRYPVVAPDGGVDWDNDIIQKHSWNSKNTEVTTYSGFTSWDGDLDQSQIPENSMVWIVWYNNKQGLSFYEWVDAYLEVEFYYDLHDSYAKESHERLGIESPFLIDYEISEEEVVNRELKTSRGYPVVDLSDVTEPPVEWAVLVRLYDDGYVEEYTGGFVVSYDVYGGTGQWGSCFSSELPDSNGVVHGETSRLLWAIKR